MRAPDLAPALPVPATYLLPIKRVGDAPSAELTSYLRGIAARCELVIVDGSDPVAFAFDRAAWGSFARHEAPAADVTGAYGKVRGVITGMRLASNERVVIADDDVRYGPAELDRAVAALDHHDLVSPQNHFEPLVWHAVWDSARSLLNRALGHDFPGTLAVRRSTFLRLGGYDGDALFENLELMRTVRAGGGSVHHALDLHVARRPPTTRHFLSQRVRQAYDEFARPASLTAALATAPAVALLAKRRAWRSIALAAVASIAVAEVGRRRDGARAAFPPASALCAPLWVLERSVTSWVAVGCRLTGGVPYAGTRLRLTAHSERALRRRLAAQGVRPA